MISYNKYKSRYSIVGKSGAWSKTQIIDFSCLHIYTHRNAHCAIMDSGVFHSAIGHPKILDSVSRDLGYVVVRAAIVDRHGQSADIDTVHMAIYHDMVKAYQAYCNKEFELSMQFPEASFATMRVGTIGWTRLSKNVFDICFHNVDLRCGPHIPLKVHGQTGAFILDCLNGCVCYANLAPVHHITILQREEIMARYQIIKNKRESCCVCES